MAARLRTVEGRLAHRAGDLTAAVATLERAARMARVWGEGTYLIDALVALAEARLAAGDAEGARRALSVARETAEADEVRLVAVRALTEAESRAGRGAARAARRAGRLVEELTDRELAILRMLPGPAARGDRQRSSSVGQHREGLHQEPLPQARRGHPRPGRRPRTRPRPDLNSDDPL